MSLATLTLVLLSAPPLNKPATTPPAKAATVEVQAKSGSQTGGVGHFSATKGGVQLSLKLKGLTPGPHAVHLHEKGDCSAADAASAGAHWNPSQQAHGKFGHAPFHLGDIGNVEAGADGNGVLELTTDKWSIGTGAENDVVGHALIVHAQKDDLTSQPGGNAAGRVGCGVVVVR